MLQTSTSSFSLNDVTTRLCTPSPKSPPHLGDGVNYTPNRNDEHIEVPYTRLYYYQVKVTSGVLRTYKGGREGLEGTVLGPLYGVVQYWRGRCRGLTLSPSCQWVTYVSTHSHSYS